MEGLKSEELQKLRKYVNQVGVRMNVFRANIREYVSEEEYEKFMAVEREKRERRDRVRELERRRGEWRVVSGMRRYDVEGVGLNAGDVGVRELWEEFRDKLKKLREEKRERVRVLVEGYEKRMKKVEEPDFEDAEDVGRRCVELKGIQDEMWGEYRKLGSRYDVVTLQQMMDVSDL